MRKAVHNVSVPPCAPPARSQGGHVPFLLEARGGTCPQCPHGSDAYAYMLSLKWDAACCAHCKLITSISTRSTRMKCNTFELGAHHLYLILTFRGVVPKLPREKPSTKKNILGEKFTGKTQAKNKTSSYLTY